MKHYIAKLSHDNGTIFIKTAASTKDAAINNIMLVECCPESAIEIKPIPKALYSMNAKHLFNSIVKRV